MIDYWSTMNSFTFALLGLFCTLSVVKRAPLGLVIINCTLSESIFINETLQEEKKDNYYMLECKSETMHATHTYHF